MTDTSLLLKAYYEALYELLEARRDLLATTVEELLRAEVEKRGFEDFDRAKYTAYADACLAFVAERIEAYNPIGFQYTFDRARAREAFELELQLNWYDSRAEFEALVEAACDKAQAGLTDGNLRPLAKELIRQLGAFPDSSIISTYQAQPALNKLPDYIVARGIEKIIASEECIQ